MKLKLDSVTFKNFLSYGSKEHTVPFYKGINIVLGKDKITGRSNGSGKSSFLETIPFALFGQTHKEIKKAQLLNWKNRRNLVVSLNFWKGEVPYTVTRAIKPDGLEIYEDGLLIDKPAHVRDYQATLEEIIGLNYQTFCSLIHSNINSSNRILSMGKPEKRKFVENVFGLSIYSMISDMALQKIRLTEDKIHELEIQTQGYVTQVQEAKSQIADFNDKLKNYTSSEPELKELATELKEYEKEYPDSKNRYKKLLKEISDLKDEELRISKLGTRVNSKHLLIEKWIRDVENNLTKVAVSKNQQQIYLAFVKKHGKPSEILDKITDIQAKVSDNSKKCDSKNEDLKQAEIALTKIETKLEAEENKIDGLKYHNECPTCGTPLKNDSTDILKSLKDNLKLRQVEFITQQTEVKKLKKEYKKLIDGTLKLKESLSDLEGKRDTIYKLKDQVRTDLDEKTLLKQKERYTKTSKCLSEQTSKLNIENSNLTKNLTKLNTDKEEIEKILLTLKSKEDEIELLKEKIKLEKQTRKEYQAIIDTNRKKIEQINKDSIESEQKKNKYINIVDYLKLIREICKDDNIKQYAISSIMPFLNQKMNHYLSEVGYTFYAILNKWIEAEIRGPGVTNASYGSLSGGEGRGIDLALQFAFLDIARRQAPIWPDTLILDEVFDSSVDKRGINKLFDIIKTKQIEDDSKIFIISHREEIDIEVDNTYFVEKDSYSNLVIK